MAGELLTHQAREGLMPADMKLDPCIFPALGDGSPGEVDMAFQKIKTNSLQEQSDFYKKNETNMYSFILIMWSIVLRRITEMDLVHFGVHTDALNIMGEEAKRQANKTGLVCQVSVSHETRTKDLFTKKGYRLGPWNSDCHSRFNTGVVFVSDDVELEDVAFLDMHLTWTSNPYDILIVAKVCDKSPGALLKYRQTAISDAQARNLRGSIAQAIEWLLDNPDQRVDNINLFSQENHQQVAQWNSKLLPKQVDQSVDAIIRQKCFEQPTSQAVCSWDGNLTYGQLDNLSSKLAVHLESFGIGPNTMVPLCFEKSLWAIVAVLAVIKTGAAFVPLDASQPLPRLESIVKQVSASIVLASEVNASVLADIVETVITVSEKNVTQLRTVNSAQSALASPLDVAYVLFTSGSTGTPKGCMVEHRALATVANHAEALLITSNRRVLQFASYSFGVSLIEIFCTLTVGATICIPSEHDRFNNLAGPMEHMRVDWALLTPSLLNSVNLQALSSLRTLVLAGEPARKSNIRTLAERFQLVQAYGLTEWAGICSVQQKVGLTMSTNNIGAPSGAIFWLIEPGDHNRLAPIGAVAELLIEGPSLARGYLQDPKKTGEVFIDNPTWLQEFRPGCQGRLYKTGDLVQYNLDGTISYVGRKDTQIKVRGQRIELGEVEYHLQHSFPGADRVVVEVIVPAGGNHSPLLTAFIWSKKRSNGDNAGEGSTLPLFVATDDKFQADAAAAESKIRASLPDYMVPKAYLSLSHVPLTISGKVNRQKLREQAAELSLEDLLPHTSANSDSALPKTDLEWALHRLFVRVVNLEPDRIGTGDSFFRLGGDSIAAIRLATLCRAENIPLTVQDIFKNETISKLAAFAETAESTSLSEIQERDLPFGLSSFQRLFFTGQPKDHNCSTQGVFLHLAREVEASQLSREIGIIVQHHSMLRARFTQSDTSEWSQSITADIEGSYRFTNHTVATQAEAAEITIVTRGSLNIQTGPVFAVDLFDVEGEGQFLFLVAHHLIVDQTSWKIILEDLEKLLETGTLSDANTTSFQKWCCLELETTSTESTAPLGLAPDVALKKVDDHGLRNRSAKYPHVVTDEFSLEESLTGVICANMNRTFHPHPADILHAVILHSFVQTFPDQHPPTVMREIDGRDVLNPTVDISRTVGLLKTVFPTRAAVDGQQDIIEMLRRTKDSCPGKDWMPCAPHSINDQIKDDRGRQNLLGNIISKVLFRYFEPPHHQRFQWNGHLLEQVSWEANGVPSILDAPWPGLIQVSATVNHGCLKMSFMYSQDLQQEMVMKDWVHACEQSLKQAAAQLQYRSPGFAMRDFPLLALNYDELDNLTGRRLPMIGVSGPQDLEDAYPCSPMQQGILLSQAKNAEYYQIYSIWDVMSTETLHEIDLEKLELAWRQLVNYHPMLRTVFIESATQKNYAIQVVLRPEEAETSVIKCSGHDAYNALHRLTGQRARKTLPRLALCKSSTGRVLCALQINHALIDATSMQIIRHDLALAYDRKLAKGGPTGCGFQYRDYIVHMQHLPTETSSEYWKNYLEGCNPCFFPQLNRGSEMADIPRQYQSVEIELENSARLRRLCEQTGLTLSNIFQVAWGLVLRSFTGLETVCFGYMTSGRDVALGDIENAVGPFINMLIARVDLLQDLSVVQVMEKNKSDFVQGLAHQHYSFADFLHANCHAGTAMFNTAMSFPPPQQWDGSQQPTIVLQEIQRHDPTEYDVTVEINMERKSIGLSLRYWTSTMSNQQAIGVVNTFCRAVSEIASDMLQKVDTLDLLSERDRDRIQEWNEELPERVDRCVHDLIHERCLAQPAAPAVCAWDGDLTYSELDDLSSRLAAHLAGLGVGPEVFVPLCFEKSRWTTVAMVGVMKAGGAFVLLDPSHPRARLQEICREVDPRVVVTSTLQGALAAELAAGHAGQVVTVGVDKMAWQDNSSAWTGCAATSDNAVYTVFTSGSTGKPKGAVIEHTAFCTSAMAHGPAMQLTHQARVFQFASYAFDISISDNLTTLLVGGCVCVPSETDRGNNLNSAINRLNANQAQLTPSISKLLVPSEVPTIRTLALIGESMSESDVHTWAGQVHLLNTYGPAECSAISTVHPITEKYSDPANIGEGTGSVCWIVNHCDHNRLVPIGAVGELLIEGPIVGRGYLNDPEKTATVFIKPPAWLRAFREANGRPAGRLYKTGDLVQYEKDGSLRFIGRKDTQVKLRGQRIELGEVEHHVQQCFSRVHNVVAELVVPTADGTAHGAEDRTAGGTAGGAAGGAAGGRPPILIAFVCCQPGESWSGDQTPSSNSDNIFAAPSDAFHAEAQAAELQLQDLVPSYMVPVVFIPLLEVPLTQTGKTDRRMLQKHAAALSQDALAAYMPGVAEKQMPSTEMECTLQQLWAQVLNLGPTCIGVDDNFFRLGGDSIMAMRLAGIMRQRGLEISVGEIFQLPKLSDLAVVMRMCTAQDAEVVLPFSLLEDDTVRDNIIQVAMEQTQLERAQIEDIYPCTALQEGLIALTAKKAGAYVAKFEYCLPPGVDIDRLQAAWRETAQANTILRTRIVQTKTGGNVQVVVCEEIPWRVYDNRVNYEEEISKARMSLGEPLIQLGVIPPLDDSGSYHFMLTMHHALYDGWSLPLLLEQAEAAYRGEDLQLQPFSRFMAYLTTSSAAAANFWRSQFTDLNAVAFPALPSATYNPSPKSLVGHTLPLTQTATSGHTAARRLQLAWAIVASQYTDSHDAVFGMTVTGRGAPVPGIERITGPTIATVPVRIRLEPHNTVREMLQMVQDHFTSMIPFEQTGLQNICCLGPEAAAACQFQTLLVIQPSRERSTPGMFSDSHGSQNQDAFTTYALTITCGLSPRSVDIQVAFDEQVIRSSQVHKILQQFGCVFAQINESPDMPVGQVSVVSPEDQRQLDQWNREVPARVDRCVHELIHERCLAQPAAPAVCAWDGNLTYSELDDLSSQLARHLVSLGVGPEVFVPLCFEKSRWTTVAMVGVMKAGGAFVLLDPSHPQARLQEICREVTAQVVVASTLQSALAAELAAELAASHAGRVVTISNDKTVWQDNDSAWTGCAATHNNAVYAVFTSGSTGKPKGVVIEHGSYATGADMHCKTYGLSEQSRVFQFASYAFDVSIVDTLSTLMTGGCLCVPSEHARRNCASETIMEFQCNWICITPSVANILQPAKVSTVRTIVLAGESMTSSVYSIWPSHIKLMNGYGPAECSACSAVQPYVRQVADVANIGYPTGAVCWIVDRGNHDQLVSIGAVGELLIEGPIVGRGYVNNPEKTAEAFIEPPTWLWDFRKASGSPVGRLYKTGDLVQYMKDGSLRYMGRKDTQVKLRGQRIELGEVEHHVQQCFSRVHNVVAEVVVPTADRTVHRAEDSAAGGAAGRRPPILVAFICCQPGESWSSDQTPNANRDNMFAAPSDAFHTEVQAAESQLQDLVPSYMVPAVFIPLLEMPLTRTGKTDRRRLRECAAALSHEILAAYIPGTAGTAEKQALSTELERMLQQLWAQVLNMDPTGIGVNDNFFRLGGDSITAMRLAGIAHQQGFELSVAEIFRLPKLSDLAVVMRTCTAYDTEVVPPFSLLKIHHHESWLRNLIYPQLPFESVDIVDVLPITQFQQRWLSRQCAYFLFNIAGEIDVDRLQAACQAVIENNSILRTVFVRYNDDILQVILRHINIPLSVFTPEDDAVRFSENLCHEDSLSPVPFGTPHFQTTLVSQNKTRHILILRLSHAQYDGLCLPVLYSDLTHAYQHTALPVRPQFSTYIHYQHLQNSVRAYETWTDILQDSQMTYLDYASLGGNDDLSAEYSIILSQEISLPCPPSGITVATTLKASWAFVLARLTGTRDLVFGQVVNGRSIPLEGIEEIVGPCANIIPVRVTLQSEWTILDMLTHVQDQHTRTLAFETLDLEDIISNSTSWPRGTQFGSIARFQNTELDMSVTMGDVKFGLESIPFRPIPKEISITWTPRGQALVVGIYASSRMLSCNSAELILQELCDAISLFSSSPEQFLPTAEKQIV